MSILTTIKLMWLAAGNRPVEIIDHVEVGKSNATAKKLAKARAEARRRHGKPFHTDKTKPRETPPSRDLIELQQVKRPQTETQLEAALKVRKLGGGKS